MSFRHFEQSSGIFVYGHFGKYTYWIPPLIYFNVKWCVLIPFYALKTRIWNMFRESSTAAVNIIKMVSLNLISILAFKKKKFPIIPFQFAHVQQTLTQTHTLMLFTEQVAPGDLSSKYGSQKESSPPPLVFSHPSPSVPEKARNVRAAQFNPAQSEITYLSSSTHLLLF